MLFWAFMLLCNLSIPAVFAVFGFLFHGTGRINGFVGYRTPRSMKNQMTWAFAHEHYCRTLRILTAPMAAVGLVPMLVCVGRSPNVVGLVTLGICCFQTLLLLASIVPTELALRHVFDKDGNPYNAE